MTWRRTALVLICALLVGAAAAAQRRFGRFFGAAAVQPLPNAPYDGRFTFVRIRYTTAPGGYWFRGLPAWVHGYPLAEENLMKILNEVTDLGANEQVNTLRLDDPQLFDYPVAYIIEVSWWAMTDSEAKALRTYLEKGGFVIVDDFKQTGDFGSPGWDAFAANIERAIPGARFFDLPPSHPIFHSFFEIRSLDDFPQAYNAGRPVFKGLFEDNDPTRRLEMVVNYNTDISQFWEWSGRGLRPFDDTNEAYKLGVNYVMYGLTH